MTLTPSPPPARCAPRALLAALVTLLAMGLVVLSGVAADAAPHGTAVLAPALSGPARGPGVAPQPPHDPSTLGAAAVALDVDDLTAPRARTGPAAPEAVAAAPVPARAAADLSRSVPRLLERPPRA